MVNPIDKMVQFKREKFDRIAILNIKKEDLSKIEVSESGLEYYNGYLLVRVYRVSSLAINSRPELSNEVNRLRLRNALLTCKFLGNNIGKDGSTRTDMIDLHKNYFLDIMVNKPDNQVHQSMRAYEKYLRSNENHKIAFLCFCFPKRCHADNYREYLIERLKD